MNKPNIDLAMKALVYQGPGSKSLQEMPKPALRDATDAIVRVTKTTICGTDLHILKGDVPTCKPGRILGHEGVGVVEPEDAATHRGRHRQRARTSKGECARARLRERVAAAHHA
jgi:D-arabinose 1-dehydrogenase-like Zn-dependent alcohol dehydrogenase